MAIDPDMQPILDAINARLDAVEANSGGNDNGLLGAERGFSAAFSAMLASKSVPDQVTALIEVTAYIKTL